MSHVDDLIEDFRRRSGLSDPIVKDAAFSYQWHALSETLRRLDVILEDEGIPRSKIDKIIRYMLYGAPSEAEADLRVELMDGTKLLLAEQTVGMPPRS